MAYIDFLTQHHNTTKRNYLERVIKHNKADCAKMAKKFDRDYWDGDRKFGYGGYVYDGRWAPTAKNILEHYDINSGKKVLDVGCGKGFLLYEISLLDPQLEIRGIDISSYAIENSKEEIRSFLDIGSASNLPYKNKSFDLILSINTLHNLPINELEKSLKEIERVSKGNSYIVVESYRNEQEKANLLYWQLTCESFFTPEEWEWIFKKFGYSGDYSFIFFE